jgi:murein DD-endopeptidase MepM/ murein hydrolase activator NlpD
MKVNIDKMHQTSKQNWLGKSIGGIAGLLVFVMVATSDMNLSDSTNDIANLNDEKLLVESNQTDNLVDTTTDTDSGEKPINTKAAYHIVSTQAFGPETPPPSKLRLTLRRNEALIDKVIAIGVSPNQAYRAIEALGRKVNLRKLQIGQEIELEIDTPLYEGEKVKLWSLGIRSEFDTMVRARAQAHGAFEAKEDEIPTLLMTMYNSGVIDDSLFLSADRSGVPAEIIIELIRAYSFEVDFQREIRPGDKFEVYYQRRLTEDGKELENGSIQYANLILRGKPLPYYHFTPSDDGRADFFSQNGASARRALMKTPLDVAVVTDSYGSRRHPVLGYTRMHKGVDFRAPTGTPIMAAGDGVIERSSRFGSFGNYVRIKHNSTYSTAYAHLSRFGRGIRQGVRVKQGQIIGYSGATGRVTGAHLHYEVMVNGKQTNPLRLKLPTGRQLGGQELNLFKTHLKTINIELDALRSYQAIAFDTGNLNASIVEPAP